MSSYARPGLLSLGVVAAGAAALGMVLAGGLGMTPWSAADRAQGETAAAVEAAGSTRQVPPPQLAAPAGFPDFSSLAERVIPSVISVNTQRDVQVQGRRGPGPMDPFEFFFGPSRPFSEPQRRRAEGAGTGFFISADGMALTNNHVIEGVDKITVRLADDRELPAKVVGRDPATDLALIQVDDTGPFTPLALGDSDGLRVGEWVMAVGNPLRMSHTVTVGVVSAKGRRLGLSDASYSFENFIQTDAAINVGNSGGPLVNLRGEVIGINTAINAAAQNIGFAVPVNHAKRILPQLKEKGRVVRGYLGVNIRDASEEEEKAFKLPSRKGALIHELVEGGPAEKAGMAPGDFITAVDGKPVASTQELIELVSSLPPGRKVALDVFRDGKSRSITVELTERPGTPTMEAASSPLGQLGLEVENLTPRVRRMLRLRDAVQGVMIADVAPGSAADDARLSAGLVITQANGNAISSTDDLAEALAGAESGGRIRLYVLDPQSGRSSFFILRVP